MSDDERTPDGLLTDGPACTDELDTHSYLDSDLRLTPLRRIPGGKIIVRSTRLAHTVDNKILPSGDFKNASKKATDEVVETGPGPNAGFESEPPSPKKDEDGNFIMEPIDEGGHPDPNLNDVGENRCCDTRSVSEDTGHETEVLYYEAVEL